MLGGITKEKLVFDPAEQAESDNVGAYVTSSDGTLITHTTIGLKEALDVNIVNGPDDAVHKEDDPHVNEHPGIHNLSVRKDALSTNTSADNDYASFLTNQDGGLWTVPVGDVGDDEADAAGNNANAVKIGSRIRDVLTAIDDGDRADAISDLYRRIHVNNGANIAIKNTQQTIDDTVGGTELAATPLAGRRTMMIQNLDNKALYIGTTGVTSGDGFRLAAGGTMSIDVGPNVDVFALGDSAGADVRLFEMA